MYPNLNGVLEIQQCKYGSSKLCVQGLCSEEKYPEPQQSSTGADAAILCSAQRSTLFDHFIDEKPVHNKTIQFQTMPPCSNAQIWNQQFFKIKTLERIHKLVMIGAGVPQSFPHLVRWCHPLSIESILVNQLCNVVAFEPVRSSFTCNQ